MMPTPQKRTDVSRQSLSPQQRRAIRQGQRRLRILERDEELRRAGKTSAERARIIRTSRITIWRWIKLVRAGDREGLEPKTGLCGRKSELTKLRVSHSV